MNDDSGQGSRGRIHGADRFLPVPLLRVRPQEFARGFRCERSFRRRRHAVRIRQATSGPSRREDGEGRNCDPQPRMPGTRFQLLTLLDRRSEDVRRLQPEVRTSGFPSRSGEGSEKEQGKVFIGVLRIASFGYFAAFLDVFGGHVFREMARRLHEPQGQSDQKGDIPDVLTPAAQPRILPPFGKRPTERVRPSFQSMEP